ncbi:helix-turn-helix domain-containing protein [Streptomyces sp. NBC_01283]|uniref:helix-turn-helix domain-containing protein n=1 Tax=Streptomyces sp. NBC_01283 TaxID=2903812 RepID=UPI00352D3D9D|nr:helix-turn-helix domain-containing protein [Streptomyces sp. NBC_01283]
MTPSKAGRAQDGAGPAPAAPAPSGSPAPPAFPVEDTAYGVARRLTQAAGRSGAELIAEAAALADGWAAVVNPVVGAVHSHPHTAGPAAVRAAAHPRTHPHLTVQQVADAVLVLGPGEATPAPRVALIAQCTADLLLVRARQAEETRGAEQRLHGAALHLLLSGRHRLATEVLGVGGGGGSTASHAAHATHPTPAPLPTHATVYRLTGSNAHTAHQALWRAAQPALPPGGPRILITRDDNELAVVALHGAQGDQSATLTLLARIAERHQLAGGAADPVPLDMLPTAWTEAGTVRNGAAAGQLVPAAGLGAHGLLRVVPTDRLTAWSAAVLRPLGRAQRRTLEAWLRSGSAQAAAPALDVSEGTVRSRLRGISALLTADLDDPTVQAQLLLALRAPEPPEPAAAPVRLPASPLPADLLGCDEARRWATALLAPLDTRLRTALRCWLRQRGRTAPAATELGLHRSTLTAWLAKCGTLLGVDLSSATVRTELHLAAETIAVPGDAVAALPRRGGRTYRGPRS